MSDQIKILLYIKNMLSDLVYINSIIATELLKITENTAVQRHGEDFLKTSSCLDEHHDLNIHILEILDKYYKSPEESNKMLNLKKHILKHKK